MYSSIFGKWHISRRLSHFGPCLSELCNDCIVIIRIGTRRALLLVCQEFPVISGKPKVAWIVDQRVNNSFLVFDVAADSRALFQEEGLLHSWVTDLLIGFMRVAEAVCSFWQLAAFVSNWILNMVVVSIWSWTRSFQFLFIFGEIVLLAITNCDLFGSAPLAEKLILVLNGHFLVNFVKRFRNLESFVLPNTKFIVRKRIAIFLICVLCAGWWAHPLEICVALREPRELRRMPYRKIWPRLLFWKNVFLAN